MKNKHPYEWRLWWRMRLPWFLIKIGVADKGKNCEEVNAKHKWYNADNISSGCYYCKVIGYEQKWRTDK